MHVSLVTKYEGGGLTISNHVVHVRARAYNN